MKLLGVLMFLAWLPATLIAQSVSGTVWSLDDDQPLAGATIKVQGQTIYAISNDEGAFELTNFQGQQISLEVAFVGYEDQLITNVTAGSNIRIDMISKLILEEVVISALRASEASPVVQKTLQRQQIQSEYFGQDAVMNLERLAPSILAHSEAGTGFANYSLMRLRGIDQTRINITLNGVPLNDMIDQGVFFSNFPDFSNNVESVQIQRGVGTSTNGTASYAGSINYQSQNINIPEPKLEVGLTGGSFGSFRGSVGIRSGLKNKWAFGARFTKTYSDGYKFNSGTNAQSLFFSAGYFAKNDLIKLTVLAGRTRNELAYLPIWINDINTEPRTNYLDPTDEDDFNQQVVQLQHSHWFNKNWSLTSSLYYGAAGGDFPFGFDDGFGNLLRLNFPLYNDHYGVNSALSGVTNEGIKIDVGIHAYIFKRKNEEGFFNETPYYSDRSQKNEISSFVKAEKSWGPFKLYGDLQVRQVSLELEPDFQSLEDQGVNTNGLGTADRDWTFFNPKIGASLQFTNRTNLYFSFGRSGREPTRADILGSTVVNPFNLDVVYDDNSVQAEYVNDLELGVNYLTPKFRSNFNFFYMDFKDEIAPTGAFIVEGFVQLRQNIRDSYRTGLEVDWEWLPAKGLTLNGQTTFMDSQIKTFAPGGTTEVFQDVTPILSPQWISNTQVAYRFNDFISVALTGRYVGDSYLELTNDEDLTMPEFVTFNLNASFDWKGHQLVVHFNNIFDEQYFTNGAPVDADFDGIIDGPGYLVQAPRNVFATLKLNF